MAIAVIALVMGFVFRRQVLAADTGTEKMREIGGAVEEGAQAYLRRQFKTLVPFVVIVFGLLFLLPADTLFRWGRARSSFLVGALFSASIGYLGMTPGRQGQRPGRLGRSRDGGRDTGMKIAFRTGGTVGMATVGLGLLGAVLVVLIFKGDAPKVLEGFGFGAALLAMFMRVGGGIFTKAADVGADLVGKVEAGIPEDDPRNAATIADNVGDNVGDCAGMAADLFESYAVMLVAALILGSAGLRRVRPRLPAHHPGHRRADGHPRRVHHPGQARVRTACRRSTGASTSPPASPPSSPASRPTSTCRPRSPSWSTG